MEEDTENVLSFMAVVSTKVFSSHFSCFSTVEYVIYYQKIFLILRLRISLNTKLLAFLLTKLGMEFSCMGKLDSRMMITKTIAALFEKNTKFWK